LTKNDLTAYHELLGDIKVRVRQAQIQAALSVNATMILLYWDIGRMIAGRQAQQGWGAKVIPRLAIDLKNELPEEKGFSPANLKRMVRFWSEYPALSYMGARPVRQFPVLADSMVANAERRQISAPTVRQIGSHMDQPAEVALILGLSWSHNIVLMQKLTDLPTRLWYARQSAEQGWSRDRLTAEIKSQAHKRQGAAVTNFAGTLPEIHAALATGLLKDPYLFDFLTLEEPFHERELETGLLTHIEKFLLELGRGFAFVGRQYELTVSDREFYLDLLFYHLKLRCFFVVDLKKGDFKPEYAGKMNFYCSAVDTQLRHETDAPTIGLILCQTKDRIIAEYSLRDIDKPIGVADYELTRALPEKLASSLPSIEDIEAELAHELDEEA
jgi:predicted nuclease of restriction endonuclease-like (RecB) superfamily